MSCACLIEMDHEEDSEIIFEKKLTICKNQQKCCECGISLTAGDQYLKEIAIYDCEVYTYRTCIDCISIRNNIFCGWMWTNILQNLQAEIEWSGGVSESCISVLTLKAKERVCDMIEAYWEKDNNTTIQDTAILQNN